MWHRIQNPGLDLIRMMNDVMSGAQTRNPQLFPNVRTSHTILLTSNYSGHHDTARFESYSFLLTTPESWSAWEQYRAKWRSQLPADARGRRMSYKNLNDGYRQQALPHLLAAAGGLHGLSFTVLVDRSLRNLFVDGSVASFLTQRGRFNEWGTATLEKLFRVVTFAALLVAGFSGDGQHIIWVTDEDDIAANYKKLDEFTCAFGATLRRLLSHDIGSVQCCTTELDVNLELEDLVAIPDLIAGTLSELLAAYQRAGVSLGSVIAPPPADLASKARFPMDWISDPRQALKRFVMSIELAYGTTQLLAKHIVFHSSIPPD